MRVVTLLPSATDIVVALDQQQSLVGLSHSCDIPAGITSLLRMTRTAVPYEQSSQEIDQFVRDHLATHSALYDLNLTALAAVRPDVIISQGLCDVCAVSTAVVDAALCSLPTQPGLIDLNPNRLTDIFSDIQRVGDALKCSDLARKIVATLQQRVRRVVSLTEAIKARQKPTVVFLEWLLPPFNGGHWNPELVQLAGGIDLLGTLGKPSQGLGLDKVFEAKPDVLFIACCGFSIERTLTDIKQLAKNPGWRSLPAVRNDRVYLADGRKYFARPGPSVVDALERMAVTLHPRLTTGLSVRPFARLFR